MDPCSDHHPIQRSDGSSADHPAPGRLTRSAVFAFVRLVLGSIAMSNLALPIRAADLPTLEVTQDDTRIDHSCRLVIAPGTFIEDANTNGILHIVADGLTVEFADGSALHGAPPDRPWDTLKGWGLRVDGRRQFTLRKARIHGYFCGIVATRCDGLSVIDADLSDNYRQRLRSTPLAEDASDWLYPHHNDETKWRDEYGGALCVEEATEVTLRGVRVRRGQNGIILDRVRQSRVFDNDCSFLSGWGLAMWRSSSNIVSRNAFDFCVRGHVEGVYNRGQDSAGILCFEQCSDNLFLENSVTHGGDGFFGFAGQDAIGEHWFATERERLRKETGRENVDELIKVPEELVRQMSGRGCNRNLFLGNDFSYAAAHGIELTFSFDNQIVRNRLVENAICGFWGGFSARTLITGNRIEGNGGMAYGLERGGINMEHASENLIIANEFVNNRCAIHLWWHDNGALLRFPGIAGNPTDVAGNRLAGNLFRVDEAHPFGPKAAGRDFTVLQIRTSRPAAIRDNSWLSNRLELQLPGVKALDLAAGISLETNGPATSLPEVVAEPLGAARPVGARPGLRGRNQILMDEWGPWDHASPLVRTRRTSGGALELELRGFRQPPEMDLLAGKADLSLTALPTPEAFLLTAKGPTGVTPLRLRLHAGTWEKQISNTLVRARWDLVVFPWTVDPRTNLNAWRALANGPDALRAQADALEFNYGWGGPRDQPLSDAIRQRGPTNDHFGMIAETRLWLPAGRWRFRTLSDDGVRLFVDGKPLIENWAWHGPTQDNAVHNQARDAEVELKVEHFEIDGYAVLNLEIEPEH